MKAVQSIAVLAAAAQAVQVETEATLAANPIRKVVTMLQNIQKKVEAEKDAEQALFDKYMCYCKNGAGDLEQGIAAADTKIPQVGSAIKEAVALKEQLDGDVASHQSDRAAAKDAMSKATALREKEAKAYAALKSEADSNIAAIIKAVASLEKGMAGGAFLQTPAAETLRNLFQTQAEVSDNDRQDVLMFLSGSDSYVPQSGQITGILKQLGDEMDKNLMDATSDENAAIKSYDELMAAKTKEVDILTAAIEEKTMRSGETAVSIEEMKHDLSSTEKALMEDKKFLADLEKNCAQKEAEYAEMSKERSEELLALSDTIKLLNDDDALELFKKTLPSAASSFVQVEARAASTRSRALELLHAAQKKSPGRTNLDFIALALRGKKIGFEKVITMIDEMVDTLKTEQKDDDDKKDYCEKQFDETDDTKKQLEQAISDAEKAIADAEEGISTLTSEIKALNDAIKALDKSVAEATEQRQKENAEYTELMASNTAAVDLIGLAKNRLNKFYNPKLYVAPPKRELSEEDRIAVSMGGTAPPTPAPGGIAGTGITALAQTDDAPAPPPQAPSYSKKTEENNGVVAMMDLLIKDLKKEMQTAEAEEKDAQADYEVMAADAAEKRAADASAVTEKEAAKAETEATLQAQKDSKASSTKELLANAEYIASLHAECDWLLQHFDARAEARSSEVEALKNAKAVLSGADYALLQTNRRSLRGTQ